VGCILQVELFESECNFNAVGGAFEAVQNNSIHHDFVKRRSVK
jgi:hypothetical protein